MPNDDLDAYLDPAPKPRRGNYDEIINRHAQRTGLDPSLVKAVMGQESGGNPNAVSPKGARGPMQLMPATAARFGVKNPHDPEQAIRGGTDYLKFLNDRYKGNRDLVLAGYNAGEGAVDKFHGIPPYKETQNYVKSISQKLGAPQQKPSGDLDQYLDPVSAPTPPKSPVVSRQPSVPSNALDQLTASSTKGIERIGRRAKPAPPSLPQQPPNLIDKIVPNMVDVLTQARNSPQTQREEQLAEPEFQRLKQNQQMRERQYPGAERANIAHTLKTDDQLRAEATELAKERFQQERHQPEIDQLANKYRGMIRGSASVGAGPTKWAQETLTKAEAGLADYLSAGLRAISDPKLSPMGALLIDENKANQFANLVNKHARALQQAAEQEGADRNVASKMVQDVVAGTISSTPELAAMAVGLPAPLVFGAGSAAKSYGRGEKTAQIAKSGLHGAATGAAFEAPALAGITGRLARAGTVGAGTTAIDLASGASPTEAFKGGVTNALLASTGGSEKPTEARLKNAETKADSTATTPSGENRAIPTSERPVSGSEGSNVNAEGLRATESNVAPSESAPRRWQHTDFGEIVESPNQKRVGRGRVRVTDESGVDHVVKKANLSGGGNQRAIPIKEAPVEPTTEPDLEGYLDKPESQLQQSSGENLSPVDRGAGEAGTPRVAETTPAVEAQPVEPSTTSARQDQFAKDRAELDLPELPAPERKSWQTSLDAAKPEDAHRIAEEAKRRGLNEDESASIVVRAQQIKNEHAQVMKEIGEATDPDVISQKRAQVESLEKEFDTLSTAVKESGTKNARALAAHKLTINQDFDLVSMKQRAKAAKGRELTPEESARYEKMAGEIDSLKTQLADAQAKQVEKNFQKEITKISKQRSRKETRKALDDEFVDLRTQFAQARAQIKNVQASGLAGIDPEGTLTKIVIKMAHNRAKAGTVEAKALVSEIYNAVKEHVDELTERDIRDAISGYSIAPKTTRTELQKRLDAIRSELQGMSKAEDIEAGVRSPRREGPRESDIRKVPLQGPKLSDARRVPTEGPRKSEARRSGIPLQGPRLSDVRQLPAEGPKLSEGVGRKQGPRLTEAPLQGPRLSDIRRVPEQGPQMVQHGPEKRLFTRDATRRAALEKEGAEIERRLRERDFSPKPKKEPIVYSRETQRVSDRIAKLKSEYERELEREKGLFWQNSSGMRKAWLLSGLYTQARNIGGTGAYQVFDEAARMPAAIADALASTVTGQRAASGASPSAMLDSVLHAVKEGGREAKEIMKLGATKEQLERQQLKEINTGSKVIDTVHNAIFRFMSASDRVFYQQAYRRNLLDRATAQARTEHASNVRERARELADKPSEDLAGSADHDAMVATFNNSNKLSDAIRRGRSALGPEANFAIDLVLPFDRTPTNVIARVLEASPVGYAKNAKQLANAIVKRSMSVEDQRQFSQTFGRATTGTALLALGWYLAPKNVITTDDYGNAYLNVAGKKMNLTSLSPVGNLLGVGANLYAAAHKDKGKGRAIAGAIAKPVSDLPILRSTSDLGEVIKDPERSGVKSGARLAGSFVPFSGALRDSAQFLDPEEKRSPKTFTDQIKANLPKLRESVPVSNSPLFAGKTASTPAIKEAQRLGMRLVGIQISPKETPEEYEARRAKIVPVMQRELDELVGSAEYKAKSDKDKQIAIKTTIQDVNDSYQRQNPKPRERHQRRQKEQYQFR